MKRILLLAILAAPHLHGQGTVADYERATTFLKATEGKVFRSSVRPNWQPDGQSFWYRNHLPGGQKEDVLIDVTKGERRVISDANSLPRAQSSTLEIRPSRESSIETWITFINQTSGTIRLLWIDTRGRKQPYQTLAAGQSHRQHTFAGHMWLAEDESKRVLDVIEGSEIEIEAVIKPQPGDPSGNTGLSSAPAPARQWDAFIRDHNVWARHRESGAEFPLSTDGKVDDAYREPFRWAPDGIGLVAMKTRAAQRRDLVLVESSPKDQLQPKVHRLDYLKPGDRIAHPRPQLFDLAEKRAISIADDLFPNPWDLTEMRWDPDGSRFTFLYNQRGHQLMRLISVDARTGATSTLIEETSPAFIDYAHKTWLRWLDGTGELLWMSERDGWNHLWLFDGRTGTLKNQVTRGEWVVRGVDHIDEKQRRLWLRVMGVRPGEDPYHVHLARVNFDGTGFVLLTEGDGTHRWEWSPDRSHFIDTWSRVDLPPVTELRRAEDGALVARLEQADASALLATGWRPPERFTAKGRDGATDIHGILIKPSHFDPTRRYPVIESIYAGPHGFFVPKEWDLQRSLRSIAELGFIVVRIDGMGTNWRSRRFHQVAWKNLKDAGLPDRILWLKAAAASRPWLDLDRVGIYGGSAGGQSALAALLWHGDFYRAAVADCGCHDNRMDKIWWNEAWMGWPVGPEYADNSNVTHAARLNGKLMLTVGELDRNVDPASTLQVAKALVDAGKDFELLILPGAGHGAGESPYAARRRLDFFVRHLHGVEPRRE